ncbi:MAG: hypothetical protein N4A41_06110 [Crocinitomicaceae bacterium]|jgi:hypothetical protein|nr:hypothetical protein [Crocinitomicaceae bacterium]
MEEKLKRWIEEQKRLIQMMDSLSSDSQKEIKNSKNSAIQTLVQLEQFLGQKTQFSQDSTSKTQG